MSKWVRSARVRRVSSHATRVTSRRTRSARRVMSSRLPIGVATTKRVPLRLRRLLLRFRDEQRPLVVQDDLARDDALLEPLDGRQVIHDLEHDLLQDRPEPARAGPHAGPPHARLDDLLEADEGAAAEEEDVRGVDLDELLVRVLPPALGWHVGHRALEDLEQGLLDALARDVPCDRGVLGLARDLVDLVDIDDAALGPLDVVIRRLEQAQDDVLDVLADVARLRERGGVGDRKRHAQHLREGLREEGLAGARGTDEENVRLLQLDLARLAARLDSLVVVVDRDGQDLLRPLLADHVLVEDVLDLGGFGERADLAALLFFPLLGDDIVAELDALVADVHRRAGDQFTDVILALPAERALQGSVAFARSSHRPSTSAPAPPMPRPRPPPGSSAWTR